MCYLSPLHVGDGESPAFWASELVAKNILFTVLIRLAPEQVTKQYFVPFLEAIIGPSGTVPTREVFVVLETDFLEVFGVVVLVFGVVFSGFSGFGAERMAEGRDGRGRVAQHLWIDAI